MRFGIRELIFILLLIGTPIASYVFRFQPRNIEIAEARDEIQRKQVKLSQLQLTRASMDDLQAEIDRLSNAIDILERQLPEQREVEVILKEVWRLAAEHRLTPKSVRSDRIINTAQYAELPLRMEITGNFDGFYSFLLELEKLQRITRIPTMKMRRLNDEDGSMQADLVLSIFFEGKN